jgi:predicted flavoprotein YhiN
MPLRLLRPAGILRAISSAGGIDRSEVDGWFQLKKVPGSYAVGEMLDWEAPTGGYLLQASFSTAVMAARHLASQLKSG